MSSNKAKIAKDEGNAAFKSGDYPAAIGHYTFAILADGNDLTFPLNRAAAYLKLGKNEDAERDCTIVLKLSPSNVKALFRRGQARTGLGCLDNAHADLVRASELEPSNQSVKQELEELERLIRQQQQKRNNASTSYPATVPSRATFATMRKRVPIEIVEHGSKVLHYRDAEIAAEEGPKDIRINEFLQPISSRTISSFPDEPSSSSFKPEQDIRAPLPIRTISTRTQTFKDAKQSRDAAKPSRVGGGIFRPSGNHTLFTRDEEILRSIPGTTSAPAIVSGNVSTQKAPMNLVNFTKMWESHMKDEDRWKVLSGVSPTSLPIIFQASLEPALLSAMLHHFERFIDQQIAAPGDVRQYMVSLSKVQRFGTIMLFMSKGEKMLLSRIWEKCGKLDS